MYDMENISSVNNFNNELFTRAEENGTTVYDMETNSFVFYEGLESSHILNGTATNDILASLHDKKDAISRNVILSDPFRINWMISNSCNLNCIYCYADDKMDFRYSKLSVEQTASQILKFNPMVVGITGGEPLMNRYLEDAISAFKGKCGVVVDTNGTIDFSDSLMESLKVSNATVRITIDSADDKILNILRPSRSFKDYPIDKIANNISKLKDCGVRVAVHSVMTKPNIKGLVQVGDLLVGLGVDNWQIYPVDNSRKCQEFYSSIKVTNSDIDDCRLDLEKRFSDKINLTVYDQRYEKDDRSVVLVDHAGKFLLDSMDGLIYIENKPNFDESHDELMSNLNVLQHCKDYLSLYLKRGR
jgi:sulfatase maturation enzyme AslB (radical SAM superfamily)